MLETLTGQTLAHLVANSPRSLARADISFLGLQLCSAVGYLHRHDVLHLDLKPSNVVCRDGQAVLIDLSIARRPGRTGPGVGTSQYMSPEQARGGRVGPAADVWGIGATLFEAATATAPFARLDEGYAQLMTRAAPIDRTRRLTRGLCDAIGRCLSPEPKRRPSLDELGDSLEAVLPTPPTSGS